MRQPPNDPPEVPLARLLSGESPRTRVIVAEIRVGFKKMAPAEDKKESAFTEHRS